MSEEKESISSTSHVTDLREGKKQAILDLSFKHHEASKKKKKKKQLPVLRSRTCNCHLFEQYSPSSLF
jgi:hypothetical protein